MASMLFRNLETGAFVQEARGVARLHVNAHHLADEIHLAKQFNCKSLSVLIGQKDPTLEGIQAADLKEISKISISSAARTKDKVCIDAFVKRCTHAHTIHFDGNGAILSDLSVLPDGLRNLTLDVRLLKNRKDLSLPGHVKRLKLTGLSKATDVAKYPPNLEFLSIASASLDGFSVSKLPTKLDVLHIYSSRGVLQEAADVHLEDVRLLRIHVGEIAISGVIKAPRLTHGYFTKLKTIAPIHPMFASGLAFVGVNKEAVTQSDIAAFNLELADGYATHAGVDDGAFPTDFLNGVSA